MKKNDWRYKSYPFMREKSCLVDYEIRTDSMTTQIGHAIAVLEKEEGTEEIVTILRQIQPLAYHTNGSVRGRLSIAPEDLAWLDGIYDEFVERGGEAIKQFVLPQGSHGAACLHICRSEAKKSYRTLHKVSEEREVPEILFQFLGLLANVFFVLAVEANKLQNVEEIIFVSKSYGKIEG
jgi:cob(I)alamin adenosyltransferase